MGNLPCFLVIVLVFLNPVSAIADTYIPLGSPVYSHIKRLEGDGLIKTAQLSTLPISRLEGARLVAEAMENIEETASPYVKVLIAKLKEEFQGELDGEHGTYLKPIDQLSSEYAYSDDPSFFRLKNRDGVAIRKGNNGFVDLTAKLDSRFLGLSATPEFRVYNDESTIKLKKGYALMNLGREEFFFGKDSNWWGSGENGTLLLSNNAEPITMVKVSNSIPYDIFGVGCRGTFFISRLEEDRNDIQNPIFYGLRLELKPFRFLEIGLTKTAIFGGDGRKERLGAFWDSLIGRGENAENPDTNEPGDQRAGYDVKITIPFGYQPITLYLESAGEDEAGGLPSKWAYIYGFYLPRIGNLDRLELRGEYTNTVVSSVSGVWYAHHIYTQGYTNKGRVIGHYIGGDAKDLFLWGRYNFDTAAFSISYERLRKYFPSQFDWEDYGIKFSKELFKGGSIELSGNYSREETKNFFIQLGINFKL
ncbi:MAG: capsule assembly Wzi family protein [Geobacter sp.]|nr:capsule assembly Wzi family protein [Geobacter sp.]